MSAQVPSARDRGAAQRGGGAERRQRRGRLCGLLQRRGRLCGLVVPAPVRAWVAHGHTVINKRV